MQISFICCAAAFGGWLQDNIGSLKTPLLGFQAALTATRRARWQNTAREYRGVARAAGQALAGESCGDGLRHRLRGVAASVQS